MRLCVRGREERETVKSEPEKKFVSLSNLCNLYLSFHAIYSYCNNMHRFGKKMVKNMVYDVLRMLQVCIEYLDACIDVSGNPYKVTIHSKSHRGCV